MIDLTGHVLNKVEFNEEDGIVSLTVDDDKVFLVKVEEDCCSTGKFIGVSDGYSLGLPQKIASTRRQHTNFDLDGDDSDVYKVYQDNFVLENGRKLTITYDNYSNGYYGSSLEIYYGGEPLEEFPGATK